MEVFEHQIMYIGTHPKMKSMGKTPHTLYN